LRTGDDAFKTVYFARSVDAGVFGMPQPLDLVLDLQLLTLEFQDSQVIDRWMGLTFDYFVFEGLVLFFEFREVRLHRHQSCLLNQWLLWT
jgi:hypothetical protein